MQRNVAIVAFLPLDKSVFLIDAAVDEGVLPFAISLLAQRGVERRVASQTAVHVDHFLPRHAEPVRD